MISGETANKIFRDFGPAKIFIFTITIIQILARQYGRYFRAFELCESQKAFLFLLTSSTRKFPCVVQYLPRLAQIFKQFQTPRDWPIFHVCVCFSMFLSKTLLKNIYSFFLCLIYNLIWPARKRFSPVTVFRKKRSVLQKLKPPSAQGEDLSSFILKNIIAHIGQLNWPFRLPVVSCRNFRQNITHILSFNRYYLCWFFFDSQSTPSI